MQELEECRSYVEEKKIIDDFLEQEDYELIRNVMMSNDSFHWQFADGANYRGDGHHMFCHVFYAQWDSPSPSHHKHPPKWANICGWKETSVLGLSDPLAIKL